MSRQQWLTRNNAAADALLAKRRLRTRRRSHFLQPCLISASTVHKSPTAVPGKVSAYDATKGRETRLQWWTTVYWHLKHLQLSKPCSSSEEEYWKKNSHSNCGILRGIVDLSICLSSRKALRGFQNDPRTDPEFVKYASSYRLPPPPPNTPEAH